jgi:DNA polymerase-3 subunit delta'
VRIEQVRELTRWLAPKPLMATRKIAILDDAHCLNEHGQNALLKTLEEPPPSAVLVLCAASASLLLPTVRSRCQIHLLDPLPVEAVERVLAARGVAADRIPLLAARAEGAPGRMLALDGEDATRARARLLETLARLGTEGAAELSRLAQDLARGPLEAGLAAAVSWYRDVLESALLGEEAHLRNPDVAPAVLAAAARLPAAARLRQLEAVCGTLDALGRNANRMLAVETMLLRLRAIERGEPGVPPAPGTWTSSA